MERKHFVIWPLLIALVIAGFKYCHAGKVVNPETGRVTRVALSTEQEDQLGLQSYHEVLSQAEVVTSGPEHDLMVKVAERLARATGDAAKSFKWEVNLVRSSQVNAFCLPGGKIVVYTGILPYTKNEAALAAVMGHEMAHAVARHGSQRLLRTSMAQTLLTGASLSMGNMDMRRRAEVMAALGAGAQYGVLLPFSREHETEADEMGLLYMARAGYDPHEAISFWQRMSSSGGSQPPQFASDHPSHANRIQDLEKFMPKAMAEYDKSRQKP
jgi:predicted Zn-dependent protease